MRSSTLELGWVSVTLGVVCLASAAVEMDEDMAELARMVRENCADETGVDLALVEAVNAGASLAASPDPTFKCYIKCTMETAGMMDEGVVDTEAVVELLPDSIRARAQAGIIGCGTHKGADDCDTAYLTQICWQNSDKQLYFLI